MLVEDLLKQLENANPKAIVKIGYEDDCRQMESNVEKVEICDDVVIIVDKYY